VYHTTQYETHKEFLPEILSGLKAVNDVVKLDHLSRLGLRYLDAVLPKDGETVDQYLADGLQGVQIEAMRRYSLSESVFETDTGPLVAKGTLVARVHRMNGPLGYPPDMVPNGLTPLPKFENVQPMPHAVIDTDHFVEGTMSLDFDKISEQLSALHGSIKQAFGATISDHAKRVWA